MILGLIGWAILICWIKSLIRKSKERREKMVLDAFSYKPDPNYSAHFASDEEIKAAGCLHE